MIDAILDRLRDRHLAGEGFPPRLAPERQCQQDAPVHLPGCDGGVHQRTSCNKFSARTLCAMAIQATVPEEIFRNCRREIMRWPSVSPVRTHRPRPGLSNAA